MKLTTTPGLLRRSAQLTGLALSILLLSAVTPASARAEIFHVFLDGTVRKVPKGNTIAFKITRIPPGIPGTLELRVKWHTDNFVPTYAPLRVELRHGGVVVLSARNCYSLHSPSTQTPKCNYGINVTTAEAARAGDWTLTVTNNSEFEVSGFNIHRDTFDPPTVPSFQASYTTNCSTNRVTLDMEGSTLTLTKGSTQERRLYGIGASDGEVQLRMKWHAVNLIPNTFNPLKIEVMNGSTIVASSNCYSNHASGSRSPICNFKFQSASRPTSGWKLRVTNNANDDAKEFNIRKEGDPNPFVTDFSSSFVPACE